MPAAATTAASRRRQIVRACKIKGWTIQPAALSTLERILSREQEQRQQQQQQQQRSVLEFLEQWLEPHMTSSKNSNNNTVTDHVLDKMIYGYQSKCRITTTTTKTTGNGDEKQDEEMAAATAAPGKIQVPLPLPNPVTLSSRARAISSSGLVSYSWGCPSSNEDIDWDNDAFRKLYVVSAFGQPKLVYNSMRQQFFVEQKEWSLFGTAEEKVEMLAQRYALIHQRILRHEKFRPTSLTLLHPAGVEDGEHEQQQQVQLQLTPLERLLGQRHATSWKSSSILVLAMLRQIDDDGRLYLEDPSGLVPISLQGAHAGNQNLTLCQDHIYLVEGVWHDGILRVLRMGPPLLESRADSLKALHQQFQHVLYQSPPKTSMTATSRPMARINNINKKNNDDHPVIILSNVYLDQPMVVQQLEGLLTTYEVQRHMTPLFVFMGNFSSTLADAETLAVEVELAAIVKKYPHLSQHAHFVLVPGPRDILPGKTAVLPWAMSSSRNQRAVKAVAYLHVSTNPTRLYWQGSEIVLYRSLPCQQQAEDGRGGGGLVLSAAALSQESSGSNSHNPTMDLDPEDDENDIGNNAAAAAAAAHLQWIQTLLDQAHLAPEVPIYWNYDHALRLYPLPTCLVVGSDQGPDVFLADSYGGCRIIAPGSFGQAGQYVLYNKTQHARDQWDKRRNMVLDDDEEEADDIQLLQLEPLAGEGSN